MSHDHDYYHEWGNNNPHDLDYHDDHDGHNGHNKDDDHDNDHDDHVR